MLHQRTKRRQSYDHCDMDDIYKFQILLPNGTSVSLALRNPGPKMPIGDFIQRVEEEYILAWKQSGSMKRKRDINWKGGSLFLEDDNDKKIRDVVNFKNFQLKRCHILRLHDGLRENANTFENMWDLTPDTDILKELPEEYTFETALADLIDNSLQAVWSNERRDRRLISVDVVDEMISIFDTGPGMDGSDRNSIVKWGKMGASLHRPSKERAIGGKPPYLMPFFGMFGYGGLLASLQLGRRVLVSSKTKESKKVYTLHLDRNALLRGSGSDFNWKTDGGMRDPSEDEISRAPHRSFTKVEIFEPKSKLDISQVQCKLKDIYFPYIQCDEESKEGKTTTPVQFEVNGVDLAEIAGGETAISNLHSCNGPNFVFQLYFYLEQDNMTKSPDSKTHIEANARLKCVYFPIQQGKESIERILEMLESEGCRNENFETYSRVSIRRLGRLLPDAHWAWIPFMEFKQRIGDKAHLLKRCCSRVKCFIETDAGFNPTPSKTDLAHHNPFTTALRNFGNKPLNNEKDIKIEIYRDEKQLTSSQLKRDYEEWILLMHDLYDDEADCGEDQPVFVVSPANKKALRISSDVARVHHILKRKNMTWKSEQKVKLLKGACAGVHKNNVYATIEYFVLEGLQGDSGGEGRIICSPLGLLEEKKCTLSETDGDTSLDIRDSLSVPVSVIDSGKCLAVESIEWNNQLERQRQKSPSAIDLLDAKQCQELEVDGALPVGAQAGKVPPEEIVAVVRPGSYVSSSYSQKLDQKYIVKSNLEMSMEVKFRGHAKDLHIYALRVGPKSLKGIQGLYRFPLKRKRPDLFRRAGVYTFSFYLNGSNCKKCEKRVLIKASSKVGKWELLSGDQSSPYFVRVGSFFPPLTIACYDICDNQIPFASTPEIVAKVHTNGGVLVHLDKFRKEISTRKMTLTVKDMLIESNELDKIRPSYEASLVLCSQDGLFSISVPCQVNPGPLQLVQALPPTLESQVLPGCIIRELKLEMFDQYGNHVTNGFEVQLNVEGFSIQDQLGPKRKVDHRGCIDLGGLLKVTAGYGKNVSISVYSNNEVVFNLQSQTEKRELRIASKVPEFCMAGTQTESLNFEVVNSVGIVDNTIHHEEKTGQFHMLTIKSGSFNIEESIRYTFKHGRCTVPAIPVPQVEGSFCFEAAHSFHPELNLKLKVPVMQAPKVEYDEVLIPCSNAEVLPLQDSSSLQQVGNLMVSSIANSEKVPVMQTSKVEYDEIESPCPNEKVLLLQDSSPLPRVENLQVLEEEIKQIAMRIGDTERKLDTLKNEKAEIEQAMPDLQASVVYQLNNSNYFSIKEELKNRIQSMSHTAASVLRSSREFSFQGSFREDVIGLVALLGTVGTSKLSRMLAEYLGQDQMLAVVCRSFATTASLLDKYDTNGRFLVIGLEDIRPYTGDIDDQGKLALPDPIFPNGNTPAGFLGYAVNMIDLDINHLQTTTSAGHGLRETLFYFLFGELHVYETRENMLAARACVKHDAISLDGWILKQNAAISLGRWNSELCFRAFAWEDHVMELLKQIEGKKSVMTMIVNVVGSLNNSLRKLKKQMNKKTKLWHKLMDDMQFDSKHHSSQEK